MKLWSHSPWSLCKKNVEQDSLDAEEDRPDHLLRVKSVRVCVCLCARERARASERPCVCSRVFTSPPNPLTSRLTWRFKGAPRRWRHRRRPSQWRARRSQSDLIRHRGVPRLPVCTLTWNDDLAPRGSFLPAPTQATHVFPKLSPSSLPPHFPIYNVSNPLLMLPVWE